MNGPPKIKATGTMLDLWRPPSDAGDPIGCITSTFTFTPSLFDEQCLARFLEIESEPNREDLAFLLEREARLGGVYAGVLVDQTMAGVEHSLRWDVLPVRIPGAKQHSKLSVLLWSKCIRVIVASANLSEQGYRTNFEVAASVDLSPQESAAEVALESVGLLRSLISFVPGSNQNPPQIERAIDFLTEVERRALSWDQPKRGETIRRHLICTLPTKSGRPGRSSLDESIEACRRRGNSPHEVKIASPFYDVGGETDRATAELCKKMAYGKSRKLVIAVPSDRGEFKDGEKPRLAAPKSLLKTARKYVNEVEFEILPSLEDKNARPWHAKMMALSSHSYVALMVGSSNFTSAGLGIISNRNAEANLLTVVDRVDFGRETNALAALWPKTTQVADPDAAEWIGAIDTLLEEEQSSNIAPPSGFLYVTFHAGDQPALIIHVDPEQLPNDWRIFSSSGKTSMELVAASDWVEAGCLKAIRISWPQPLPPDKLMVKWGELQAFIPINVEDAQGLPPPTRLEQMTADDMLGVLAATDPSAAIRAWARNQRLSSEYDEDLDSAGPVDLDPLRRYELGSTFLHRIRRRARVLTQMRANLERPCWGRQALEWRLRGLIGMEVLSDRLVKEFEQANGTANEALLTLADFLIVLREADYQSGPGALSKAEFETVLKSFLKELAGKQAKKVEERRDSVSQDAMGFWERVVVLCQS